VNQTFLWGCSTWKVNRTDGQGIESSHAYSILEARTIPDGTRLLKVRNPWGESEWKGDWSDRSKQWTDDLRQLLKHEDKDDGIFWISYEDLLRNYPFLHRTRIFNASWTVAQLWTNFTVPILSSDTYESVFKFTLSKAATTAIVLSQLDDRYFKGLSGLYDYRLCFRLHRFGEDICLHRCHPRHECDRSINLEVELEAGVYEVRLKVVSVLDKTRSKVEDVIKVNWKDSRKKLLQTCRSYDLAHARAIQPQKIEQHNAKRHSTGPNPAARPHGQEFEPRPDQRDETAHQDRKSDTGTNSTEPEMIEKADAMAESANGENKAERKTEATKSGDPCPSPGGNSTALVIRRKDDTTPDDCPAEAIPEKEEDEGVKVDRQDEQATGKETEKGNSAEAERPEKKGEENRERALEKYSRAPSHHRPEHQGGRAPSHHRPEHRRVRAPSHHRPERRGSRAPSHRRPEYWDSRAPSPDRPEYRRSRSPSQRRPEHRGRERRSSSAAYSAPPYPASHSARSSVDGRERRSQIEEEPVEPFTSVCTVGLRVYCKDAEATIELVQPSTATEPAKQFTSSEEAVLDVDDPARG
jgi:hypothetical protein